MPRPPPPAALAARNNIRNRMNVDEGRRLAGSHVYCDCVSFRCRYLTQSHGNDGTYAMELHLS